LREKHYPRAGAAFAILKEEKRTMSWNQDRLVGWIIEEFRREQGIDLSKDPTAMQRVKEAAEKAEIELKSVASIRIKLPFITADASGPKHLNVALTRAQFEAVIAEFPRQ